MGGAKKRKWGGVDEILLAFYLKALAVIQYIVLISTVDVDSKDRARMLILPLAVFQIYR
jgi:hypothetical protein